MNPHKIIFIHGLAQKATCWRKSLKYFSELGFTCHSLNYPSRQKDIPSLSRLISQDILEHIDPKQPYYVVTHSLGGILIREALAKKQIPYPRHCFLLAPPNHGSPIPSFLGKYKIFRQWLGPAFCQLADIEALPLTNYAARLGNIPVATTILIGTRNLDFYFAPLFKEQNDGKVSRKSAQGIGEEKYITGPWSHMNIIKQSVVLKYIHSIIKQSTANSKKAI